MRKITLLLVAIAISFATYAVGMSGTYKVGTTETAPNFTSLKAAIDAVNANGVAGNVLLEITSDLTEVAPVTVTTATGSFTITIKPAASTVATVTFSGCSATAGANQYTGFTINATNNITIDGSNTVGGITKDLTFKVNDATNGRHVIQLYGNADYVTIKNLNVYFQSPMTTSSSSRGIYLNGQSTGASDNFTVENCAIGDVVNTPYYAVGVTGYGTAPQIYATKISVKNCILNASMRTVYLYYVGSDGTTSEISGNLISNPSTTITGYVVYGIMLNTYGGTIDIKNNKINTIKTNNATSQGLYGISALTAQTGAVVNIFNNFIGNFYCLNAVSNTTPVNGIFWQTGQTVNIINNTINLSPVNNTTGIVGALRFGSTANATIKNNILINPYNATTSYGIYWSSTGTLSSNYNNIYVSGASANVGYFSSAKATLSDWQIGTSKDANSKSIPVNFTNAETGDLSLAGASVGDWQLAVPKLATVTTDIDGTNRAALTYAGADEAATDLTTLAKQFSVTVPNGTSKVYAAGSFTGKNWDNATPFELMPTGVTNQFSGILPCVDGVEYKYLCEIGDWDYEEGRYNPVNGGDPLKLAANRTYNAADNVVLWYRANKITLNVSFDAATPVPTQLFVKGSFNGWTTGLELTKSGNTFSKVLGGNPGDKYPANTEYKYFTNDINAENWESDASGLAINNRWSISPVMNDVVARFTTMLTTNLDDIKSSARILRTSNGIEVQLNREANIELYTINGVLIDKTRIEGTYARDLNNGIYIIRIDGKATKFMK